MTCMLAMLIYKIINPRFRVNIENSAVIVSHAYSCLCMLKRNRMHAEEKYIHLPEADAYAGGLLDYLLDEIEMNMFR